MVTLKGIYNTCEVFAKSCDDSTISQLYELLNQESVKDSKIRIMPDCHAGKGCVVGTTMTLHGNVIPNLVGVDIGCGMLAVKLKELSIDLADLDRVINKYIPAGFNIHEVPKAQSSVDGIYAPIDFEKSQRSLGSLGGGNHFIEIDKDKDNNLWLVIHTGSRHLGIEVCDYYQNLAYEKLKNNGIGDIKVLRTELIERLTKENRTKEISAELQKLNSTYKSKSAKFNIPKELAYVTGEDFEHYIHDMNLAQIHAKINRKTIANIILERANLHAVDEFDTIHNYIDTEHMILRKGSISARAGERVIIPMNMRDGSLICVGKGNDDWNQSAPHGAGRIMSRTQARNNISFTSFQNEMGGIYSSSVCESTLDEAPQAYKPMQEIVDTITPTVDIVDIIKPIYNFKAH